MRRIFAIVVLLLITTSLFAKKKDSLSLLITDLFKQLSRVEPVREGKHYDSIRGQTVLINPLNPSAIFFFPGDGAVLSTSTPIIIRVKIENWIVDPAKATSASTQFAVGKQEYQTGHTHVWIYNQETGERVRFTGANGLLEADGCGCGCHGSVPFFLPPGYYKAYVSLQNHDHTLAVQSSAQSLQAFDAVVFQVIDDGKAEL